MEAEAAALGPRIRRMMSRPVPDEPGGKPAPRAAAFWPTGLRGAGKSTTSPFRANRDDPEFTVPTVDEPAEQTAARLVARLP
jgi:hypothetical protein